MEATELTNKYLVALQELHKVLSYTKRISLTDFCNQHKLNIKTPKVLVSGGILKRNGTRRYPEYTWETIKPNIHMAEELTRKLKKENKAVKGTKSKAKQSKTEVITKVAPSLDYKITTLFFGLIKIKTQYHYKSL